MMLPHAKCRRLRWHFGKDSKHHVADVQTLFIGQVAAQISDMNVVPDLNRLQGCRGKTDNRTTILSTTVNFAQKDSHRSLRRSRRTKTIKSASIVRETRNRIFAHRYRERSRSGLVTKKEPYGTYDKLTRSSRRNPTVWHLATESYTLLRQDLLPDWSCVSQLYGPTSS